MDRKIRAVNIEQICPVQLKDDLVPRDVHPAAISRVLIDDRSSPMSIARSKSFNGIPNPRSLETRVEIHSDDSDYEECEASRSPEADEEVTAFLRSPQCRRRSPSVSDLSSYTQGSQQSFTHAASETYLITRLAFKLLKYLGIGYRWICKFIALSLYALFLLPGFIQIGWYYFFSKSVRRSIVYGDQPRNRLDLYLPPKSDRLKPAVAFVTGGAWIIGYKAWGALFGRQLAQNDIIVACIDYRNFPQGSITNMVDDVSAALAFLCKNIDIYGGNMDRLYLAGQSAGAHIAACTLVEQARKEGFEGKEGLQWSPSNFKAFFGISGGYNLLELVDHFHNRGLYRSLFLGIMEGEGSLPRFSPELVLRSRDYQYVAPLLPPMVLFHGTADYSIPCSSSDKFASALLDAGVNVRTRFYEGKTHTDIILQDPMRGGKDQLVVDVLEIIHDGEDEMDMASAPFHRRMVPECLLQLARKVSPF